MKRLFLVESPTKIKTLKKILEKQVDQFTFLATLGHIKDLPTNNLGIDLDSFEPKLVFLPSKLKLLHKIKEILPQIEEVFLATDPDREGEAISMHLYEYLRGKKKSLVFKRLELREITPHGLKEALKKTREIDKNLYQSWKARRVLDRLIGYLVSPKLSQSFKQNLSAGRVQSPALKLIVDREREIENFVPQKSFSLSVALSGANNEIYIFELFSKNKLFRTKTKEELLTFFVNFLSQREVTIFDLVEKVVKKLPPQPLKTSTLIELGERLLNLQPKETMFIAQGLYEKGYITYMRTDSVRVSPLAKNMARKFIEKVFGSTYVGGERRFKVKGRIQDAHECIRPTNLEADLRGLSPNERALYGVIHTYFLASQMKEALFRERKFIAKSEGLPQGFTLQLKEMVMLFDGFLKVLKEKELSSQSYPLYVGCKLRVCGCEIKEHESKPPERYTPQSLIKKLEALGIGRPSTYPIIIDILLKRGYVVLEGKWLKPTELGKKVCDYLSQEFSCLMEYSLTSELENALDTLAQGQANYQLIIKKYYNLLKEYLTK